MKHGGIKDTAAHPKDKTQVQKTTTKCNQTQTSKRQKEETADE